MISSSSKEQNRTSILRDKTLSKRVSYMELSEQRDKKQVFENVKENEEQYFDIELPKTTGIMKKKRSSRLLANMGSFQNKSEYYEVPLEAVNPDQINYEYTRSTQCTRSTQVVSEQSHHVANQVVMKPEITIQEYNIFLLANPKSGSRKARRFLENYANTDNKFVAENGANASIRVLDVINQRQIIADELENALRNRSEIQEIVVAVMGGDGSLCCFIESMKDRPLIIENLQSLLFVPLPFGTGNDLGRSLGWGAKEGPWAKTLHTLANHIIQGEQDRLTLWEIKVKATTTLGFSGRQRVKVSNDLNSFRKLMCCYFNLGFDAEVANSFETVRSGYRIMNYMYYTYFTLKGAVCTCDLVRVGNFVDNFTEIKPQGIDQEFKSKREVVFKMEELKANPFMMVGVNIPSNYGGMFKENWNKFQKNCALPADKAVGRLQQQNYGDAKLEIMGASSRSRLICAKEMQNFGQVEGPFEINFRKDLPPQIPINLAIDGESYQLLDAKKMKFTQYKKAPYLRIVRGPNPKFLTGSVQQ